MGTLAGGQATLQLTGHVRDFTSCKGKERILKISIFGLGYVGMVSAGCFALDGYEVIGVDPVKTKVDLVKEGRSPIIEADIDRKSVV